MKTDTPVQTFEVSIVTCLSERAYLLFVEVCECRK